MRVRGSISPAPIAVEPYSLLDGHMEVRLRENINEFTETDPQTETTVTLFEYDEYTFLLKDREGLQEDIESNFNDWLTTGRTLEVNERASIVQKLKGAGKKYENLIMSLSEVYEDVNT